MRTHGDPVVQDQNCQTPAVSEAYRGTQCTGTVLDTPGLPEAPHAANAEDLPGPPNFSAIVGNDLTILVHMRLAPRGAGEHAAGGS